MVLKIPCMSPKPTSVESVEQARISLIAKWSFKVEGTNTKDTINDPGEWKMQCFTLHESIH